MSCSDQIKISHCWPGPGSGSEVQRWPDPRQLPCRCAESIASRRVAGASAALRSSFRRCRHWRMTGCLGVPADPWPDPVQRGRRRIGAQHDDQPPARWHRDHGPRAITRGAGPPAPSGIPVVETWNLSDRPIDMLVGVSPPGRPDCGRLFPGQEVAAHACRQQ